MKINFSKSIIAIAFITLFSGSIFLAQTRTVYGANALEFNPQIPIPGMGSGQIDVGSEVGGVMTSDLLAKYLVAIYDYGLTIISILAVVILMGAGLIWLTSGGNETKITQAKDLIAGSLTGIIILFGAWMLLNTVNPQLLKLNSISLTYFAKEIPGCCEYSNRAEMTTDQKCKKGNGTFKVSVTDTVFNLTKEYYVSADGKTCTLPGCCITDRGQGLANSLCINSMKQECNLSTSKFEPTDCQAVSGYYNCTLFDQCETASNGSTCIKDQPVSSDYCYNKLCWKGLGGENEPCGNDPGALCSKLWLPTASLHPGSVNPLEDQITCLASGYKHDGFSARGRNCESGLACCYPE